MKFSRVPLDDAEGTLLAHSLHFKSGRLKKGHKLSAAEVAALRAAGYGEVMAATLEPGEVGEDGRRPPHRRSGGGWRRSPRAQRSPVAATCWPDVGGLRSWTAHGSTDSTWSTKR